VEVAEVAVLPVLKPKFELAILAEVENNQKPEKKLKQ